ncbi:hypothetical protein CEXT_436661 [Caerostris extrusa]|uniref:Adult-specific rigid cuticular protein 15.7 n=1 Tax=Caerostris extrusa TaxID=172846 RepID=A0AAV4WL40_CAEEX|nr:hypothetical protein CEXT_436661 [Caerostris extrusa]
MIAQIAFFCAALVAASAYAPLVNTGVSTSSRQQDVSFFGNYAFGYGIKDGLGATNSRSEVGDGYGNKKGSYTISDIDGRARRGDYVADGHGFRATVKTNEPGTAASAPAAALIASPYAGPVAPVVNHIAPAAPAVAVAAPVAYGAGALGLGALVWDMELVPLVWDMELVPSVSDMEPLLVWGIRSWRLWCWTWQGYPVICDLIHLKIIVL